MLKEKSFNGLRLFIDLIIITYSFLIAASISISFNILLDRYYMFGLLILMYITWYLSSISMGFYSDAFSRNLSYQFVNVVKMALLQTALAILFIFFVKEEWFIRNFTFINAVSVLVLVSLRTIIFKQIFYILKQKGKFQRNLIIIGAGENGQNFYKMVDTNQMTGYSIIGFIDDSDEDKEDLNIIGKIDDLDEILAKYNIQEAVIALPSEDTVKINKIIKVCNNAVVRTHIVPDYFKFLSKKFHIGMFGNIPIISVRKEPLEEIHWKFIKRGIDIVFSTAIIITVISWLFPIIIIIQKLTSKGPVFFIQDRIGKNKEKFRCFKFRTMYVNADTNNYKPTIKDDSRVIPFGSFLRKTSLDETPQIFNVLIGDMSLVGPRPHPLPYHEFTKEFSDEIELRSLVKPGVTGWAQVNGYRGDAAGEEESHQLIKKKIQFDLWYIENWTLWLDIQIIILTLWQMIQFKNIGN